MAISRSVLLLALILGAFTTASFAGCVPIPYCDIGQVAPTVSITAQKTGDLFGSYFGHIADFTDLVRIIDVTADTTGPWVFNNQTSVRGNLADFGFVTAGDTLVVQIWDQQINHIFASDPAFSDDGINHGYLYGGVFGDNLLPLAFVGMEDLQESEQTDWDYNDSEFFLFRVLVSQAQQQSSGFVATPEPASLLLMGTSLFAFWRKRKA